MVLMEYLFIPKKSLFIKLYFYLVLIKNFLKVCFLIMKLIELIDLFKLILNTYFLINKRFLLLQVK